MFNRRNSPPLRASPAAFRRRPPAVSAAMPGDEHVVAQDGAILGLEIVAGGGLPGPPCPSHQPTPVWSRRT
jgi:hypothetical protein